MYVSRVYRRQIRQDDLVGFQVSIKETDLYISVDRMSFTPEVPQRAQQLAWRYRQELENYIKTDTRFFKRLFAPSVEVGCPGYCPGHE